MRFFSRRGRSKSVGRNAKSKNNARSRQQPREQQPVYKNDRRHVQQQRSDESVGSELPTQDQFEIAVPSKSFASVDLGEQDRIPFPLESREDNDDGDNRSTTDMSSITSVSYRAGYYYLRNIKKKAPAKKPKSSGCCALPSCSCAACMPCGCSWLTCCCCSEAKTELTAETLDTAVEPPVSKNSLLAAHPQQQQRSSDKARKSQSPGRRAMPPQPRQPQDRKYTSRRNKRNSKRTGPTRRYTMADSRMDAGESPVHPSVNGNHSLFDELSEGEEDMAAYGSSRRRQQQQQQHQQQQYQRKGSRKTWLKNRRAGGGHHEPEYSGGGGGGQKPRTRSRGRRRRSERY